MVQGDQPTRAGTLAARQSFQQGRRILQTSRFIITRCSGLGIKPLSRVSAPQVGFFRPGSLAAALGDQHRGP